MKTATVLLLALSIASSASGAAVINPSANTRRIGPGDDSNDNYPRSPIPAAAAAAPPVSSASSSPIIYNNTASRRPTLDGRPVGGPGSASIKAASRRRPWGWNQPPSGPWAKKQRRSADADDDDPLGFVMVGAGLAGHNGGNRGSSSNANDDKVDDKVAAYAPASASASSSSSSSSNNAGRLTEPRRRPDGWGHGKRSSDADAETLPNSSSQREDFKRSTSDTSLPMPSWAGIIVGASIGATLLAAGLYAVVVKRRQRSATRAERQALYAEKREEDDRRVWEDDDHDAGEWGVQNQNQHVVPNGGSATVVVGDPEKGGVIVKVEDYRGVSRG
ncbi:hypothetical protein BFW01_g934 [Lasiodiplodia theobromae]|uniref:Uncharacterized protein n=1 Tax=Lasiodiplodia theobromae TaxID=45133 RepID=A0A8H7IRC2_9PEZI|nr:hypothetical protein BFW01_g934 [Lasiodiplodia theobromae]